ncbi:MAG: ORF6N domain-containing protein [Nitrospiraceae bacterium]|nr:MAG: ORF6N domain-containing protein [Nitrospiraceae bacterium]
MSELIPIEVIEKKIYVIRRHKVMLDSDLSELYGVETKVLNRAVRRNLDRFPGDFMFQLTKNEYDNLRFQFGTSRWGGRRYAPYVFTEQGVSMLSSILNSKQAIQVNILIMRTFVNLRKTLSTHKALGRKMGLIEQRIEEQDKKIYTIFEAIRQLMSPSEKQKRKIGFKREKE